MRKNFWKKIPLERLTKEEWEAICDGCGKCCLIKLQNDTQSIPFYTSLACQFLNTKNCKCKVYTFRDKKKRDCLILTPDNLEQVMKWLPNSCAYRLLYEGQELPFWHHLRSGSFDTVHHTGKSVQGTTIPEYDIVEEFWDEYIVEKG